jgi:hypothetical protein
MNGASLFSQIDNLRWYELGWPEDLDSKKVVEWLQALSGHSASVGIRFVTVARSSGTRHYIALPKRQQHTLLHILTTFLPGVEVTQSGSVTPSNDLVGKLRMTTKSRALEMAQPEVIAHALLSTVRAVGGQESITIEWVLGPRKSPLAVPNKVSGLHAGTLWGKIVEAIVTGPTQLDAQARKSLRDKVGVAGWKAALYIGVDAPMFSRRAQLMNQVVGAIKSAEAPGVRLGFNMTHPLHILPSYTPWFWPLAVNTNELAGLLGWPLGSKAVEGVQRIVSRRLPIPETMPQNGRVVATSVIKDSDRKLTLTAEDGLMHTHVIGPTGVGKSTLLLNMITRDIADNRGVVVIDPKGDLVKDVLSRVPKARQNDVVVLDPSDLGRPVGLNPLARHDQPGSLIADNILAIFRGLYGSYFGPRTQDILHAGLLTLTSTPGLSLCTLPILYTNPAFRWRLVNGLHDPLGLGSFWSWYDTISDAERNAVLAPVMNKLRAFLLRPAMRRVIGQGHPKFNMTDVFTKRKILLVNLAKGSMGTEAAQLFGSLVVSQVWQAVQGRSHLPQAARTPAFVYVDEVQDYLHLPTDVGDVLAQSRSYGVGMVLAHQHLGQLPGDLKSGVLSNARSKVCFQLSHEDAVVMAKSSKVLTPEDFENLNRYHIYGRLVANGEVMPWASGKTLKPTVRLSDPELIKLLSRQRYGQDAADVETELGGQIAGTAPQLRQSPIGRKKIGSTP